MKYLFILFGICILSFFQVFPSSSTIIDVGPGYNFTTIQEAVNNSQSGDVIFLHGNFSGTSNVGIDLTGVLNFTIQGEGIDFTSVDCQNLGNFVSYNFVQDLVTRSFTLSNISFKNCFSVLMANTGNMNLNIQNCSFETCSSSALFIMGQRPINTNQLPVAPIVTYINNCLFSNNTSAYGGAIYGYYTNLTVLNSNFYFNSVSSTGGAIYIDQSYSFTNVVFQNNVAYNGGAAVSCNGAIGSAVNIIINGNQDSVPFGNGNGAGCGWLISEGNLHCTNCTWKNNQCIAQGGAVYVENGGFFAVNNQFIFNLGASGGGGVYNSASYCTFNNCVFQSNTAYGGGGALYISDSGISYHFNNTISSNNASTGGALYLEFSAFVTFESSTITNNMAFQEGGGIYCSDSTVNLTNTELRGNNAPSSPDFDCSTSIAFTSCIVQGNSLFSCPSPQNQNSLGAAQIVLILFCCLVGTYCIGICIAFVIYFSDKKNRIAQGFIWNAVVDEE